MEHFYFLIGLGLFVLLAALLSLSKSLKRRRQLPYVVDATLFNPAQRAFKAVLERAVGKEYEIHGKVRAADVMSVRPGLSRRDRESAYDRLGDRCFDFLVCRRESTAIVCAVNLTARSRLRKRPPTDALDRVCAAAGLPLLRFRESDVYSVVEVEERIFAAIQARDVRPVRLGVDDIHTEEAASMLHRLGQVIKDERPASRRSTPSVSRDRPESSRARTLPDRTTVTTAAKRREPIIREQHVLDDEPDFKISGG